MSWRAFLSDEDRPSYTKRGKSARRWGYRRPPCGRFRECPRSNLFDRKMMAEKWVGRGRVGISRKEDGRKGRWAANCLYFLFHHFLFMPFWARLKPVLRTAACGSLAAIYRRDDRGYRDFRSIFRIRRIGSELLRPRRLRTCPAGPAVQHRIGIPRGRVSPSPPTTAAITWPGGRSHFLRV